MYFSIAAFKVLFLSLTFNSLIIMSLVWISFAFILFGVHWNSWMYVFVFFIKFETLSLQIVFLFHSPFSPSDTSIMGILECCGVSHKSLRLCLFSSFCFFFYSSYWIISINLFPSLLILLLVHICY